MIEYFADKKGKIVILSSLLCLITLLFPLWYEDFGLPGPDYPFSSFFYYPIDAQFSFIFHEPSTLYFDAPDLRRFPMRIHWRSVLEEVFVILGATLFLYFQSKKEVSNKRFLLYLALWSPLILPYAYINLPGLGIIYRFLFEEPEGYGDIGFPLRFLLFVILYLIASIVFWGIYLGIGRIIGATSRQLTSHSS